ncbi:MAG: DUF1559 domain-containing protein, partial [Planctomycetales bacterium]
MVARASRKGFTLVELLVVMSIIAVLSALIIPGVQAAREAARATSCRNNMRQIGLAIHNFESTRGMFPPGWAPAAPNSAGQVNGWSAHALLLPFLEQKATHSAIDFKQDYSAAGVIATADGKTAMLSALRVPTYLCPSEARDEVRVSGGIPTHYPVNYAVNSGVWFVWDPSGKIGGDGAFYPDSRLSSGAFLDGMTYTLALAEVKAWTPYYRNASLSPAALSLLPTSGPGLQALGGEFKTNSGHTEWVDGRVHQTGFTTTFKPNSELLVNVGGETFDVDWTNQQEGKSATTPTFAAVTASSYHGGVVNAVMMDASVHSMDDRIDLGVWRALSTRRGQEILPNEFKS